MPAINKFDINKSSKISKRRRKQLNQMAKQAFLNTGNAEIYGGDHVFDLRSECFAMEEVLTEVSEIGSYVNFYHDINRAFGLLLKENPEAFRTYTELTTMLRIFSKHSQAANAKLNEITRVLADLDILQDESLDIKNGGSNA